MGATGLGYELARQFGLKVIEPRPALVPLVLGGDEASWTELAGVAAEVVARPAGRARELQGEDAGDASRAERAGGVAGVFVLAAGGGAGGGFCAWSWMCCWSADGAGGATGLGGAEAGAARGAAAAAGGVSGGGGRAEGLVECGAGGVRAEAAPLGVSSGGDGGI